MLSLSVAPPTGCTKKQKTYLHGLFLNTLVVGGGRVRGIALWVDGHLSPLSDGGLQLRHDAGQLSVQVIADVWNKQTINI